MSLLHVEGVTHWSIPVNNLEEAEAFYGNLLGLTPVGRLGTARMACFTAGEHHILLCERAATIDQAGSGKFESERSCADKRVNTSCGVGFVYFCSILLLETLRCGPSNCTFPMTLSLP
jgi:catechol 2,3-dioxygenase-like lactoylglutathione lyase family enzyme